MMVVIVSDADEDERFREWETRGGERELRRGLMGCRLQVRLISMREYKACGAQGR